MGRTNTNNAYFVKEYRRYCRNKGKNFDSELSRILTDLVAENLISEKAQQFLFLNIAHNQTYTDIAKTLNVPRGSISRITSEAIAELKSRLILQNPIYDPYNDPAIYNDIIFFLQCKSDALRKDQRYNQSILSNVLNDLKLCKSVRSMLKYLSEFESVVLPSLKLDDLEFVSQQINYLKNKIEECVQDGKAD